jgi:hypothetical protein
MEWASSQAAQLDETAFSDADDDDDGLDLAAEFAPQHAELVLPIGRSGSSDSRATFSKHEAKFTSAGAALVQAKSMPIPALKRSSSGLLGTAKRTKTAYGDFPGFL